MGGKGTVTCNWDYLWNYGMRFWRNDSDIKMGQISHVLRLVFGQKVRWRKVGQKKKDWRNEGTVKRRVPG